MLGDVPCITYMALYILSFHILQSNSRTSTYWKLNPEEGKIVEASQFPKIVTLPGINDEQPTIDDDPIFNIITSTVHFGTAWTKRSVEYYCTDCQSVSPKAYDRVENASEPESKVENTTVKESNNSSSSVEESEGEEYLDCGKSANFTYYDHLVGVANRHNHPHAPEPQVSLIFRKRSSKNIEFDINALERKLKKAKKEKPKSVQLYNQIGNFWRVKGDAQKSIECFRRALAVSPNNAEVLLNLARVLFNLQYLDDAIYLTRRSLEVRPPEKNAWQQYFTLGEILKAYGHYPEAARHLRHALELKPEFEPAMIALRDMESVPDNTIHIYTLLIIVCLVLGVLLVILSSVDGNLDDFTEIKTQRHFNRAMAMRSLKMGISQRAMRAKRYGGSSSCTT
ncbi:tetratricopeptide repeat protein 17-like [Ischnura elegans]|uniref:tetratricopeptide repeat protein 17-like n=1 Tax=Ischnura elegans TaxID=197161 RepID=UPI001ED8A4BF|nr:tetratricopeptide repeat protein 17-like [Ischnura elegans]